MVDSVGTAVHCEKSYFVNERQSRNAYLPMLVTLLEIITPVKKWQDSNTLLPMLVTVLGIVIFVNQL